MYGGMKGRFLTRPIVSFLFFSMFDVYHLSVMGKLENKPRIYQYSTVIKSILTPLVITWPAVRWLYHSRTQTLAPSTSNRDFRKVMNKDFCNFLAKAKKEGKCEQSSIKLNKDFSIFMFFRNWFCCDSKLT